MRYPLPASWPAMPHDLDFPLHLLFDPLSSFAGGSLISPDVFQARKGLLDGLQKQWHPLPILDIRLMYDHRKHETSGVHQHMPFPARDFFAAIIAVWSTSIGGLHRLAVNDPSAGSRLSSRLNPTAFPYGGHDLLPHTRVPKQRKIPIHGGARRILSRKHPPGTASSQHVKDPVKNRSHIYSSGPSTWLLRRDQWLKQRPFCIREIGRIDFHRLPSLSEAYTAPLSTFSSILS